MVRCSALVVGILVAACGDGSSSPSVDADVGADANADTIAALTALLTGCGDDLGGPYATDDGEAETLRICGLVGAVYWHADLDVDCDGIETTACNLGSDPAYQNQTSAETSTGMPLDASTLPFVVIPLPSARWDYATADVDLGTVVGVLYDGHLEFGVFGDQGPDNILGEASYAMAARLGIDPDPSTGGTDDDVAYVAFTGAAARVNVMEDHDEAAALGAAQVGELLTEN